MAASNLTPGQHIMFSYGWDIQQDVLEIYHRLQGHNIPVWMDIQGGMKDYLSVSMSEAIENSAAKCCFITSKYQSSPYCKKELLYAQDCQKQLIPCFMDADPTWKPTEWLGYAIIDILYIDFRDLLTNKTPENFAAKCELLTNRIKRTVNPSALGAVKHPPLSLPETQPSPFKEQNPEGFQMSSTSTSSSSIPSPRYSPVPHTLCNENDTIPTNDSEENVSSSFDRYFPHPSHFS
ncbi:unnamed protein product [Rotaria socialis]|uniref:TIR domain-containing protein n=1 Tax=Rotaria socialis TaxID=392032 RepID=A0A818X767_9BILA|nr:unnamed protein product [Rotaria socialis]CAF4507620.1 unnamed protein product [Rotaria socialis]